MTPSPSDWARLRHKFAREWSNKGEDRLVGRWFCMKRLLKLKEGSPGGNTKLLLNSSATFEGSTPLRILACFFRISSNSCTFFVDRRFMLEWQLFSLNHDWTESTRNGKPLPGMPRRWSSPGRYTKTRTFSFCHVLGVIDAKMQMRDSGRHRFADKDLRNKPMITDTDVLKQGLTSLRAK